MMDILSYVIAAVVGYLLGNIQCAVLLSRWKYHDDVRKHGSGNAGSTNMFRVFGMRSGFITFIGDFLKGIVGVLLGRLLAGEIGGYIAALFVVLGHDFPAFMQFQGGKGVATTFGIAWIFQPFYAMVLTLIAGIILLLTKTVSVASLVGALVYALMVALFSWHNTYFLITTALLCLLIFIRHISNIERITKGTEGKLFHESKK